MKVGDWNFSFAANELTKDAVRIKLEPQSSQVLKYLCERAGEVVSRDELLDAVWGRQSVSVQSVPVVISKLRSAFSDDKRQPNYIETIAKRGYRLIAPVSAPDNSESGAAQSFNIPVRYAALAAVTLIAVAAIMFFFNIGRTPSPTLRAVYVADVANLTDDKTFNIVAAGASEILTMALGDVEDFSVIRIRRRPDSNDWLNPELRENGVKAFPLLTTSVVPCDNGHCMIMQLINDQQGDLAWTHSFNIDGDAFATRQRQAVAALLEHFGKKVAVPPTGDEFAAAGNVEELYLRAKFFWGLRGRENNMLALSLARQALEQNTDYVPAHALLSEIYGKYSADYLAIPETNTETLAKEHFAFAMANAPTHSATLAARARLYVLLERRPDLALEVIEQTIALGKDESTTYQMQAAARYLLGDIDGAIAAIDRSMELEYNSPYIEMQYIMANYLGARYEQVVAVAERLDAEYSADFRKQVAASYYELGQHEAAIRLWVEEARSLAIGVENPADILALIGQDEILAAYRLLNERIIAGADEDNISHNKLLLYLAFYSGPPEAPLELLKSLKITRDARFLLWLHRWPLFNRYSDNEEFQDYLRSLPIAAMANCMHPACNSS